MQTYSAIEYICIHIANNFGLDKLLFEERIEWVMRNAKQLRKLAPDADDKAQYLRGVMELERVLGGQKTTNMPIGLDATASGLQMLSVFSGCMVTAANVGLVDPNKRCDAYTTCGETMNLYLPEHMHIKLGKEGGEAKYTRKDLKYPFMTHFYFSKGVPKQVFGNNSIELLAFYKAVEHMAPGANVIMQDIYGAMRKDATEYMCTYPDNHTLFTRVFDKKDLTIELEELKNRNGNNSTYTHRIEVNVPKEEDVSLVANVTHGADGFVVRELQGRMNHNKHSLLKILDISKGCRVTDRSPMVSIYEADKILRNPNAWTGDDNKLALLTEVIESVIDNPVAPMKSVHDEFKTMAPYCNQMRQYYIDTLSQMSESKFIEPLLRELYKNPNLRYEKEGCGKTLAAAIRNSNYAIC